MFFTDAFFDVADFCETVSLVRRDGSTETPLADERAALFRQKFLDAESDGSAPPRLSGVWRLPATGAARTLRRGDRIFDAAGDAWIVVGSRISDATQIVSFQSVSERLFPKENEKIDVYRVDSLHNTAASVWNSAARLVAADVPAIVRKRSTQKKRDGALPTQKSVDEISFWVKTSAALETADVVATPDGARFETTAYRPPTEISDWGVLTARRLGGVRANDDWKVPTV